MYNRRSFLGKLGSLAVVAGSTSMMPSFLKAASFSSEEGRLHKLTILHTNDVHSRIEPFPMDGGKNEGRGGIAKRAALINKIRQEEEHVLLLDAGDMFQGTPYFNYFGGELEMKLMSKMGYDAGTIGNHDFDGGIDGLHKQLTTQANFPLVNCNYDFSDTIMNGHTKPYQIFQKGPIKVGVLGVGVELEGLVPSPLYKKTRYTDPIKKANHYANILKNEEKCDYVICLSHLGYMYKTNKVSDVVLATSTQNIDLIIGGHTHTFLDKPTIITVDNKETLITQVGWAGMVLGRLDVYFERNCQDKCIQCKNQSIG
ncbi:MULTISPECIES: bifunctional UDP-sugar hydrolase/5'-nucleotidase [unclassified Aureispira]|uniref:bifunctional metallophosphatase/5'-nucleotidase n=1 Tax=unclassified Aureispira TaxID=2649989 RepID=UPI000698D9C3|nr:MULTISPECIES: metallophosphatase [unclassified Aureispira]WMX14146.1 metallophosphatase [Aureispira sp. CCB-E]